MALARWDPFTQLRRMREDMDRMMSGMWESPMLAPIIAEAVLPAIDVFEQDNNVIVKADVPGLKKEDLEVTATEDSISLKGEFKMEEEAKEEGFLRRERRFGRFYRTIPLPMAVKADQVKANFKDGILTVTAPKAEEAKSRETKVPIEA